MCPYSRGHLVTTLFEVGGAGVGSEILHFCQLPGGADAARLGKLLVQGTSKGSQCSDLQGE